MSTIEIDGSTDAPLITFKLRVSSEAAIRGAIVELTRSYLALTGAMPAAVSRKELAPPKPKEDPATVKVHEALVKAKHGLYAKEIEHLIKKKSSAGYYLKCEKEKHGDDVQVTETRYGLHYLWVGSAP